MIQQSADKIYLRFLENSFEKAKQLEAESDILTIEGKRGNPPYNFLLKFEPIHHLIQNIDNGQIQLTEGPVFVDIYFPEDYLRSLDPDFYLKVVGILNPEFFHPNVKMLLGYVCLGHDFLPGTPLSDLIYHLYDIITYHNTTVDERDAFNPAACRYLREYPEIIKQLNNPPLRRRKLKVNILVEDLKVKQKP
ncbi:MAG: hypothetical protein ACE5NG_10010 [bacterium]